MFRNFTGKFQMLRMNRIFLKQKKKKIVKVKVA